MDTTNQPQPEQDSQIPQTAMPAQALSDSPAGQPTDQQPYEAPKLQGTNGLAIAGFVCSLVFLVVPGLIMSIIALGQIKKSGQGGKGLAIAGIVISGIGIVVNALFAIIWVILLVASTSAK